jgi:arylsulfatase A
MAAAMRPNIVQIVADDLGYGDFRKYNGGLSHTPVLDSLIDESLCLSQHYTASPVCNPSRATLLTGRYPHRTGSIDTLEWYGLERLSLAETTMADVLRNAGYATGLVGKWHLGSFDPRYHPLRRGFQETVCFRGGMHDYYGWRLEYGESVRRADGRYLTDVFTEEAVAFIERHRSEPFYLHVAYNAPHTPLQAPAADVQRFLDTGKFNRGVSTLYGMIAVMDRGVGRILEALEAAGIADNTIVLFSSDNGPDFGGSGENCLERFNCNLHGSKCLVYEGGIRVPMIVRWPDGLPSGQTLTEFAHFADWFPTLLSAVGVDLPERLNMDGVDILPVLRGERGQTDPKRFWQWNRYAPTPVSNVAMRDGDWKLVRPVIPATFEVYEPYWLTVSMYNPEYFIANGLLPVPSPDRSFPDPPPAELYNLCEDPLETDDLAARYPEVVSRMTRELDVWFEEVTQELHNDVRA